MNINTIRRRGLRTGSALAVVAALGSGMFVTPAYAQDATAAEAPLGDGAIIVTGSRIQSTTLETTVPVQIVDEKTIESTGAVNIQETLLRNPVFGTPTISRTNSSFDTSTSGVATVDLRNLGTSRTLVLVDGRRFVAGIPGESAVDLNAIPTALVERVDILTSGSGSAIYGSDAVAGVVNFILKKDFEGVELEGSAGLTEQGDAEEYTLGMTMGSNFADGRGNVVIHGGYTSEGAAFMKNHYTEAGRSNVDSLSELFFGGSYQTPVKPFLSSYAPQGTYFTPNYNFTYGPDGTLQPCTTTNGTSCDSIVYDYDDDGNIIGVAAPSIGTGTGPTGFNRSAYRYLAVPTTRYLLSLNANYEVSDALDVFAQGTYSSTSVRSNIEPFPLASEDIWAATGQMPIDTRLADGTIFRNPYVPDAIYDNATDTDGDGLKDIFLTKRLTDFGNRTSKADRNTFRIVTGARGDIGEKWNYEAFFNYGETKTTQLGNGQINTPNARLANQIEPVDPTDLSLGYQCVDPEARAQGCVPANWFGENSLSPEALAYLAAPTTFNANVKQLQIGAFAGGELFSLMEGVDPIQVTAGVEYRKEKSSDIWDVLTQGGLNAGNALPPTSGQFDVREVYGEVKIPLVQDSFLYDASLRAAARYSDYSTVGGTFSWNAGGEIAPIRDVRFRAMYAVTVRAPNINELYAGLSQTFPTLTDPCSGVSQDGSALAQNCFADPGVAANAAANGGTFTLNGTSDTQGVTGFDGGNPNLNEEKGKTFTAGVLIAPTSIDALRNMSLSVDYYNVKITDAIVLTPRQFILNQCYQTGDDAYCNFVTRRPTAVGPYSAGSLDEVNTGPTNSGGYKVEGIDVTFNYRTDLPFLSEDAGLSFNLQYSHLLDGYLIPLVSQPDSKDVFAGEVGASKDRFTAQAFLDMGDFRFAATGTYFGPAYLDDQLTGVGPGDDGYEDYRWHDEFYLDLQARWLVGERYEFYVGADNVLNNNPVYAGGLVTTGMDSDTGTYDPLGRRFYAGAKFKL